MDANHFDVLTQSLTDCRSRRGSRCLLGGLALAGPLAVFSLAEAETKNKGGDAKTKGKNKFRQFPSRRWLGGGRAWMPRSLM